MKPEGNNFLYEWREEANWTVRGVGWIAGTERKEKSGGSFLRGILYGVKDRRLGEFVRGRTSIKNHLA
jgi:hypothetical protein